MKKIVIDLAPDEEESKIRVSNYLVKKIKENSRLCFGGATGRTFEKIMEHLVRSGLDLSQTRRIYLDEYFGKNSYHEYAQYYNYELFPDKSKAPRLENVFVPRGLFYDKNNNLVHADQLAKIIGENNEYVKRQGPEIKIRENCPHPILKQIREAVGLYARQIDENPPEIQLLGLGRERHIGFNEQGTSLESRVHLTELAASTLEANEGDFVNGAKSKYAITMGAGDILKAGELLLAAYGESKQAAVYQLLYGEISPDNPAAAVRKHPQVRLYFDKIAAEKILEDGRIKLSLAEGLQKEGFEVAVNYVRET